MTKIYIDTETAGLYGDIFLIQYATQEGQVRFIRHDELGKLKGLFNLLASEDTTIVG
jgi:ribonuclease D